MNLVFNNSHQPIIPWKGQTFNQITSSIKKNPGVIVSNKRNFFLPNPLKINRREIATPRTSTSCSRRSSLKIDEFDRPGGSIINSSFKSNGNLNGIISIIDNTIPNDSCEEYKNCTPFLSPSENARRRVRSAGMIKPKFDAKNRPKYCTDTKQYLTSRNVTFEQNQFRYPITDPTYCVYYKPNNSQFAQQGAVSASSLTARAKYNTINTAALQTKKSLGVATSNALAYGVPENGYTVKDIIGYPRTSYPSFRAGRNGTTCVDKHIRG
jgi:hypothetical protein